MKYSCYQDYSVIHGWFLYCAFCWQMHFLSKSLEIRFRMASFPKMSLLTCPCLRRRWCASRDWTNQNALFVQWFWLLKRWVFRVVCPWIFAFFQSCGLIFETIPRRKVGRRHCVDTCDVTFENFAFLCSCEEFEVAGHVQAAMMLWALFSPFFWDSMLVAVSG